MELNKPKPSDFLVWHKQLGVMSIHTERHLAEDQARKLAQSSQFLGEEFFVASTLYSCKIPELIERIYMENPEYYKTNT